MLLDIASFARRKKSRRGAPMWAPDRRTASPGQARGRGRPYSALLVFMIVALALSLSACGKKGPPEPPEGKTDQFPRQYPDPSSL